MLHLFSHRVFRWFFGGLLTVPPCLVVLGQVLGVFHLLDSLTITLIVLPGWFGMLVAVVMVAVLRRQVYQAIVEAGPPQQYLAHWTSREEEWQRFVHWSWQEDRYQAITRTMAFFGVVLLVSLVLLIAGALTQTTWAMWNGILILAGTLGGLVFIAGAAMFLGAYRRSRGRRQHFGDLYITSLGVPWPDSFQPLQGLQKVTFDPGPPALLFCKCLAHTGGRLKSWTVVVPVPEQHKAEARQLLHHLLHQRPRR
jgi:hypothetical protein